MCNTSFVVYESEELELGLLVSLISQINLDVNSSYKEESKEFH